MQRCMQCVFLLLLLCAKPAATAVFQPELVLQKGHSRSVVAVAISPDHRWLASGSQDSTVKIWSLSNGILLRTLYGHSGKINAVAISHDGQWIASAGEDRKIRLWGIATGNTAYVLSGFAAAPTSIAFSNDNKFLIASGSDDVKIFECASGHETHAVPFKEDDRGGRSLVSADGRLVVIGGGSGKKGEPFRPYKIIDLSNGHELSKIKIDMQAPFASLAFSSDGRRLALRSTQFDDGENQESIRIYDSSSGDEKARLKIPGSGSPNATGAIAFSPDGKFIAAETELEENLTVSVHVFDLTTGQSMKQLTTEKFFTPVLNFEATHVITSPLAFSPDSQLIALGGASSIQMWDIKSGKALQQLRTNLKEGAMSAALDPRMADALKQVGMTEEDTLQASQDAGGILDQMMDPDNPTSAAVNFSKQIMGAMGRKANTVSRAFDKSLSFSGNGNWLITQRTREARIWDLHSGTFLQLPLGVAPPIAISGDGRFIAEMEVTNMQRPEDTKQNLVIRDASTFTMRSQISPESPPEAIVFSNDGNSLAILRNSENGPNIEIVDSASGKEVRSYSLTGQKVFDKVVFSSNGRFLAVGGTQTSSASVFNMPITPGMTLSKKDAKKMVEQMMKTMQKVQDQKAEPLKYEIKLIDVATGQQTVSFVAADEQVKMLNTPQAQLSFPGLAGEHELKFSPDGSMIAVLDYVRESPVIKVYDAPTGHPIATLPAVGKPSFAFSPDRKSIAISTQQDQYSINLIRIPGGELIRTLPQTGRVDAIAFSPDGRLLASMMQDETRIIWNTGTGEKLATLVEFPGIHFTTEWLVTTPDGMFDGSPDAFQQILWRFSPNTFDVAPVEAFFNELYYPGLLSEIFAGRTPKPPRDLSQIDRRQPEVHISSGDQGEVSAREVSITIQVRDPGSGARDLRLFRNGSLVKVWHGDILKNQQSGNVEMKVPIVAGENRFVAYAFSNANIKSPDSMIVVRGAEGLRRPATAHILAIGINQYSNSDFNLKFAVPDAQSFGESLKASLSKTGKYGNVEVTYLLDSDATKTKILQALQQMNGVNPEDGVFIYYAGHGTAEGARFYLVPQELHYDGSRDALDSTGMKKILDGSISDLDLETAFEQIDASEMLFVIDACNSGQALESPEKRFGLMNSKGLAQLAYEKGMYILAAAQGYQAALEAAELGHGFLTYTLVDEGLKTAAADTAPRDGDVQAREWLDYSTMRVPQMQSARMQQARLLKHEVVFVPGEEKVEDLQQRSLQRPRVFYRREIGQAPLIIAKPQEENH